MTEEKSLNFLTPLARCRSQQRGKTRDALALVYRYGDMDRFAGRRRRALRLSRTTCRDLVRSGAPAGIVERAARIEIIVSEDDGAVITVLNARCA